MFPHRLTLLLSLASAFFASQFAHAQAVGQKICEINADGTGFRDLYVMPRHVSIGSPVISADGKTLAFEATMQNVSRGRFEESGNRQAVIMTVATSDLPLTAQDTMGFLIDARGQSRPFPNLGFGVMPSWSPGGHRLVSSTVSGAGAFVMRANGSDRIQLHPQGWSATWSPDGRMIAFLNRSTNNQLQVYDLVEDEEFALKTPFFSNIRVGFAWSPDSSTIAFSGRDRTGKYLIAQVGVLNPNEYREVQPGVSARRISWHPDGSRLLYADVRRKPERLVTLAISEADAKPELVPGIPENVAADVATWAPDGKKIVFVAAYSR
jgi:Tol biopolymer transport system component